MKLTGEALDRLVAAANDDAVSEKLHRFEQAVEELRMAAEEYAIKMDSLYNNLNS